MALGELPRAPLAHLPTPLEPAPRLAQAIGFQRLWIKREDLSGLAFGGNKTRLLEFVIGDALERGVDALIAAASNQSNKLRDIAAAASRHGLRCVLLIDHEIEGPPQGNRLLFDLLGAEVRPMPPGADALEAQARVKDELEAAGHTVAILDRRFDYGTLATAAYVEAAFELADQCDRAGIKADYVVVTAGAGMTMAGLVLGLAVRGRRAAVLGIAVSRQAAELSAEIGDYMDRAAERIGLDRSYAGAPFEVVDSYVGPGYGIITPQIKSALETAARYHGLVLDPVYNGKTMAGLIDLVQRRRIEPDACVVYIHTGGSPAIFAYSQDLGGQMVGVDLN